LGHHHNDNGDLEAQGQLSARKKLSRLLEYIQDRVIIKRKISLDSPFLNRYTIWDKKKDLIRKIEDYSGYRRPNFKNIEK